MKPIPYRFAFILVKFSQKILYFKYSLARLEILRNISVNYGSDLRLTLDQNLFKNFIFIKFDKMDKRAYCQFIEKLNKNISREA